MDTLKDLISDFNEGNTERYGAVLKEDEIRIYNQEREQVAVVDGAGIFIDQRSFFSGYALNLVIKMYENI